MGGSQREESNGTWAHRRKKYYNHWPTWFWRLTSPKSSGWAGGWRPREEPMLQLEFQLADWILLVQKPSLFVLLKPSADQMRPAQIERKSPLFKVHGFKCYSDPKTPSQTHQNTGDPVKRTNITNRPVGRPSSPSGRKQQGAGEATLEIWGSLRICGPGSNPDPKK